MTRLAVPGAVLGVLLGVLVSALLGTLVAVPAGAATAVVPPGAVTIDAVTTNGSTCRPGTTTAAVSPDKAAFTVAYSDYLATVGGTSVPADAHGRCKLNVTIHVPQGYTYAVAEADYRGYAFLAAGVSAVEQARYQFQGDPDKPLIAHPFTGPYDDDWETTDLTAVSALGYAPCGKTRTLNIDTELTIAGSTASATTSLIAMDSTDGSLVSTFRLAWKQCP